MKKWKRHLWTGYSAAVVSVPALWADRYTDHGKVLPGKDVNVSDNRTIGPEEDRAITKQFKDRFVDVIGSYNARNREPHLRPEEAEYARGRFANYQLLDEERDDHGFYGAVFLDKASGKKILTIAGIDMEYLGETSKGNKDFYEDFDDVLFATAGSHVDQLPAAMALAKRAQEKYGKIDYLTGHSLGGYLALFLKGMNCCPGAECYVYDATGVTKTMRKNMSEIANIPEEAVDRNLRKDCYSFTMTHNAWNDLGVQAGIGRTEDNKPNGFFSLYPKKHIYDADYMQELARLKSTTARTNDGTSGGPADVSLLFILAATAPWLFMRIKQTTKENSR